MSIQARRLRMLAVATNPAEGASTRFRVLQWQAALAQAGVDLELSPFFNAQSNTFIYQNGHFARKLAAFGRGLRKRLDALSQAAQRADILFIHREACPLGWPLFNRWVEQFPGRVIYDYDDAMFLPQRQGRGLIRSLENLDGPKQIMRRADCVLAGNDYLAGYARQYARDIALLPTCIDTQRYKPDACRRAGSNSLPIVGWIGSHTTAKYLEGLRGVLSAVAKRMPFELYVVGSQQAPQIEGVRVRHAAWKLEREVADFSSCDVGIYPLWDDAWSQGKCGFKAIEFMACGVAVIASAVGVNRSIIQDGANGFQAATHSEWVEKLVQLLSDAALRSRLGAAGRETVQNRFSLQAWQHLFMAKVTGQAQPADAPTDYAAQGATR